MIPDQKLAQLIERYDYLQHRLSDPEALGSDGFAKTSKDFSDLEPVVMKAIELRKLRADQIEMEAIQADPSSDSEMRELAYDEIHELKERIPAIEAEMSILLLPKDAADEKSAILEIRAGTGGDEAALFAGDLFRMYQRYAETQGWRVEVISASPSEVGGFKEVIASVTGRGVFAKLKYESGVHRVQRVPSTESSGRIHTSAATVAVLPEAEEVDVQIEDKDIRIDVFRASGAGGQHVNTTDSAVRITHLPTGIVVSQQDEKSQHKNKAKALKILRSRIYEAERAKIDSERAADRKGQVGSGDRSERIRTYNFPQGRVSDHRINLTLHKIEQVMMGVGLEELVSALISAHQAEKLAEMERGF